MTANHPAFKQGNTAVITGGASGIGLAAAKHFAGLGMNVAIADLGGDRLAVAAREIAAVAPAGEAAVAAIVTDVANLSEIERLAGEVAARFGKVHVLMNNAGIGGAQVFGAEADWQRVFAVNLWGVVHGSRTLAPGMLAHGEAALIINTGSKQGITTPPGDVAYNMTKAGVKVFTEGLQHELRNRPDAKLSAHLLIPGFVFTGLTAQSGAEKPAGAWTAAQTIDFMMESLARGDFYILCPDNEVTRALDEKRIEWAAHDIIDNRPPLSRWHKDFGPAFAEFLKSNGL